MGPTELIKWTVVSITAVTIPMVHGERKQNGRLYETLVLSGISEDVCARSSNYISQILWDVISWWRHQMETFSALLAIYAGNSPVPGEFPAQRPVTRSFDVFFDLRLNQQLSKQWRRWWFETPLRSFWRHCYDLTDTVRCNLLSRPLIPASGTQVLVWWTVAKNSVSCLHYRPPITVTSHKRHGVSNRRHIDCVFNSFFSQTTTTSSYRRITGPLSGKPAVTGGFPRKRLVMRKPIPCHVVSW